MENRFKLFKRRLKLGGRCGSSLPPKPPTAGKFNIIKNGVNISKGQSNIIKTH